MKLAAIYNVFDGVELLRGSIHTLIDHVEEVIIVYQTVSNYGEDLDQSSLIDLLAINFAFNSKPITIVKFMPPHIGAGTYNEKLKRNMGLDIAREKGCTHFLHLDTDEYYQDFAQAKKLYIESGSEGSAVKLFTYFKLPTLRFETEDGYFVPFIHRLRPDSVAGVKQYPFYVDPTRRINCDDVKLLDVHMQHYSWVRKDIERKARNSSAKSNLERGTMLQSYYDPACGPGYYVKDYDKKLIEVPNYFNISL